MYVASVMCSLSPDIVRVEVHVDYVCTGLHSAMSCSPQRPPLSATLRRIGNAMLGLSQCEEGGGALPTHTPLLASNHGFCQSVDSHVRTLAVLIALRTVVQGTCTVRWPVAATHTAADWYV